MAVFLDVLTKTKFEGNKNRSTSPPTKLKLRRVVSVVCRLIKVQCLWEMLICAAFWEESQHEQKTKPTCQEGRQPVGMGLPVVMQRERERERKRSESDTRLGGGGCLRRQQRVWGETLLLLVGLLRTSWHFIRFLQIITWRKMEQVLKAASQVFSKPGTFTCYFLFNHPTPPHWILAKKGQFYQKK